MKLKQAIIGITALVEGCGYNPRVEERCQSGDLEVIGYVNERTGPDERFAELYHGNKFLGRVLVEDRYTYFPCDDGTEMYLSEDGWKKIDKKDKIDFFKEVLNNGKR
jgi:hypothetical protein